MIVWTTLMALLLSLTIFCFNLIMILAIATSSKLHSIPNILSYNMWIANCVVGVVGIFNYLFFNINNINPLLFTTAHVPKNYRTTRSYYFIRSGPTMNISSLMSSMQRQKQLFPKEMNFSANLSPLLSLSTSFRSSLIPIDSVPGANSLPGQGLDNILDDNEKIYISENNEIDYMIIFGPQTLAALFNSTVSLLALLSMAFVQIFSRYQTWSPNKAPVRISLCIWSVVIIIMIINFLLVQFTQSCALVIAFQLALISIFLMFNLVLHPLNLFRPQSPQLQISITQSLWLLLHCLSFTLLAMMLVWEGIQQFGSGTNKQGFEENVQLVILQLTAYSLHCVGNPMIAILREPQLSNAIFKLYSNKYRTSLHNSSTAINQYECYAQWNILPNNWWIIRPPPPPYRSQSCSTSSSNSDAEIVCTGSSISLNGYYNWQNQRSMSCLQENFYRGSLDDGRLVRNPIKSFAQGRFVNRRNDADNVANTSNVYMGENHAQTCTIYENLL